MHHFMIRLLAILALFVTALPGDAAHADPADIAAAARSVVRVVLIAEDGGQLALIGHGSGVVVAPGTILTNAHVIAPMAEDDTIRVGIVPSEGKAGSFARVLAVSPGNDLALIRLEGPAVLPAATLFGGAVEDGADVFAVGYPGNVDMAQGLNIEDIVTPTSPVKTRGNVSAGRSSKQFDTILHTAAIGAGNSGGPLLDACGRIVGINSFGTLSGEADSEFYFAVSMREIAGFLRRAGIQPRTSGEPCRSIADLDRAEAERLAGEKDRAAQVAREADSVRSMSMAQAQRQAQFDIMVARENRMGLAGLALLLALACAGGAVQLRHQGKPRELRVAGGIGLILVLVAAAAWLSRPGLAQIDERADELAGTAPVSVADPQAAGEGLTGKLICVLDTARSRVTVSQTTDVPLDWQAGGCVNAASQYGLGTDGWSRVLVPGKDAAVTVARFDPATGEYATARYLLGLEAMQKLRAARGRIKPPACGSGEDAARQFGESQAALVSMLPVTPNERLLYRCEKATASPP